MAGLEDGLDVKQGLHQEDPLYVALFILANDGLSKLLRRASSLGLIGGIGPNKVSHDIKSLYFADDTFLFYAGKKDGPLAAKAILFCF